MKAPGEARIAASKTSGLWDASTAVDALDTPQDLQAALGPAAGRGAIWFHTSAPSYRRNVLRWIESAKTDPTRAKRIAKVADHAKRGQKVPNY